MDLQLKNKVAIVTAASEGLGYYSALALLQEGAKVVISSRSAEKIEAAAATLKDEVDGEVTALVADVTQQADIDTLVQTTLDLYGQIDVLVLNAGGPPTGNFFDLTPADWENATQLTLMSAVRLCYAVVPHMVARGTGSITAIQSATVKRPIGKLMLSNSIRMAVVGMLNALAIEVAPHGVRVNSVNPVATGTKRLTANLEVRAQASGRTLAEEEKSYAATIPMQRIGDAAEFGKYVAFVASPTLTFVTGQAFMYDGGAVTSAL